MNLSKTRWRSTVGLVALAWAVVGTGCGPEEEEGVESSVSERCDGANWCEAKCGRIYTDPGDGSLHRNGCPDGMKNLGSVNIGIEGGLCCK